MARTKLNIKLLDMTPNAISIIYAACRQCYSAEFAGDLLKKEGDNLEKQASLDRKDYLTGQAEFVKRVVKSGHESPIEHVKFTFAVEGVSRVLTHQLVRHRLASYSQQSQRYVKKADFDYILPPLIEAESETKDEFIKIMEDIQTSYKKILNIFKDKGKEGEKVNQDARFILPQAIETKIVITMNCRELLHFFKQRCCARAQWEIRNLANKMLEICKQRLPAVFFKAGAKCETLGYCPEGEKFTCGKYPLKRNVIKPRE